jgi:hypothetical protein
MVEFVGSWLSGIGVPGWTANSTGSPFGRATVIGELATVRGASSVAPPITTASPTSELSAKLTQNERPNRAGGFGGGAGCSALAHFQQNVRDGWLVSPQFGQMTAARVELEAAAGHAEAGAAAGAGVAAGAGAAAGVGGEAGCGTTVALGFGAGVAGFAGIAPASSGLPQLPQNSAPDSFFVPQNGQVITRRHRLRRGVRRRRPRRSDGKQVRG